MRVYKGGNVQGVFGEVAGWCDQVWVGVWSRMGGGVRRDGSWSCLGYMLRQLLPLPKMFIITCIHKEAIKIEPTHPFSPHIIKVKNVLGSTNSPLLLWASLICMHTWLTGQHLWRCRLPMSMFGSVLCQLNVIVIIINHYVN